jgi:hypothetical protein
MRSFTATLLTSAIVLSALTAPATAAAAPAGQKGGGDDKPAAAAPADAAPSPPEKPANLADPELRTFAGKECLNPPAGSNRHVGPLLAAVIPQIVGAGVDALSAALDAAGTDKVRAKSAVVPLEYAATCIQVAKGVSGTGRDWLNDSARGTLGDKLKDAPLMVELFLRQSADGSALLITPTMLNYRMTVNDRQARRTRRNLYATITVADAAGEHPSQVTIPLGDFLTRHDPYKFDPMLRPENPGLAHYPLGSANSVWIPNPYAKRARSADADGQATPADAQPGATGTFGPTVPPPPAKPGEAQQAATIEAGPVTEGTPITPISLTVVLTETRPGNPIAKALAGILKGSKQGIVDAVDPTKRQQARQAEQSTADANMDAWAAASTKYVAALKPYCAAKDDAGRQAAAPDLLTAQVALTKASRGTKMPLPFSNLVNIYTGEGLKAACPTVWANGGGQPG